MKKTRNFFRSDSWLSNLAQAILIILLTGLLAFGMEYYDIALDDMKLLYLLGILIVILQTESFLLTLFSTVVFVILDAFLVFREDERSLGQYIISTIIFVVIALIVNVIAIRLQKQIEASRKSELVQKHLYEASKGLIRIQGQGQDALTAYADEALTKLTEAESHVYFDIKKSDPDEAKKWCLRNSAVCGSGELDFPESTNKYIPIRSNRKTNGVAVIDCSEKDLSPVELDSVAAFLTQISFAMERNLLEERSKKENAIYAREKIKGTVMRGLSNDMYPHIKQIDHITDELQNDEDLTDDQKQERYKQIRKETAFLADTVDNAIEITSSK